MKKIFTGYLTIGTASFLIICLSQLSYGLLYHQLTYSQFFSFILPFSVIASFAVISIFALYIKNIEKSIKELLRKLKNLSGQDEIDKLKAKSNAGANIIDELTELINHYNYKIKKQKKFTEDVTHELRTPLTIMRGEIEIALVSSKEDKDYIMTLASTLDEVLRLSKILDVLLDLTRSESGKIRLEMHKNDLSAFINDIAADAKILAGDKSINVRSEINQEIIAVFDSVRLHQAILNLIDNAIKYTEPNGNLLIKLSENYTDAIIEISDTGIGIPEDKIEKVFDRFFRVKEDNTDNIKGVGLGLSIVKMIINEHNGSINIKSQHGAGTTFVINLPKEQTIEQKMKF